MDEVNKNYKNLIEDLLVEKEELLKKLESKGAHALRIKALRSEINRCKRVLAGKTYDRRSIKQ
jgi:chromosome segregation ATPase